MASGYDERDDDRYDERNEGRRTARREEYDTDRGRYDRENAYGYGPPRSTARYGAGRDDAAADYDRDYNSRDLRTRDYDDERGDAYGGYTGRDYRNDYERGAGRTYERPPDYARGREDYGRAPGYARDPGRDYDRDRDRDRDYYGARGARSSDYDRGPRGYNYDPDRGDWSLRRGRGRGDEEHARPRRGDARDKDRGWWERVTDEVASWFGDEGAERRRLRDERQTGAHHRGRGPRGYRRTDERIREDINDRLTDHPYIDASDIEVLVTSGEVTLAGAVESRQAKRLAEDIAESVSGVTHVENRLRINRAASDINEPSRMTTTTDTNALPSPTTTGTTTDALPLPTDPAEVTKVSATSAGANTAGTGTPSTGRSKPNTTT